MCVESYLARNEGFMEFLDGYKVEYALQSKARTQRSRALRKKGNKLMEDLALTEAEVENIFDILEEEIPEL